MPADRSQRRSQLLQQQSTWRPWLKEASACCSFGSLFFRHYLSSRGQSCAPQNMRRSRRGTFVIERLQRLGVSRARHQIKVRIPRASAPVASAPTNSRLVSFLSSMGFVIILHGVIAMTLYTLMGASCYIYYTRWNTCQIASCKKKESRGV
jgi:hypothetical protein